MAEEPQITTEDQRKRFIISVADLHGNFGMQGGYGEPHPCTAELSAFLVAALEKAELPLTQADIKEALKAAGNFSGAPGLVPDLAEALFNESSAQRYNKISSNTAIQDTVGDVCKLIEGSFARAIIPPSTLPIWRREKRQGGGTPEGGAGGGSGGYSR